MRRLADEQKTRLIQIIAKYKKTLEAIDGFVDARPGFPIVAGRVVKQPAILIYVREKKPEAELTLTSLAPRSLEGVRVDVVQADPERQLRRSEAMQDVSAALDAAAANVTYRPLPGSPIDTDIEVEAAVLCHVGPDAGWPVLKKYLEGTQSTLTVAMYDFNADWISKHFTDAMKESGASVVLTWDDGMNDDESAVRKFIKRELGGQLDAWIVVCGKNRRFASAYHEKVAVRDSKSMWISSGNWSRRSQPNIDPIAEADDARGMFSAGNREWHAVIHDGPLSKLFERYIKYDRDESEAEDTALALTGSTQMPELFVPMASLGDMDLALAVPEPVAPKRLPSSGRRVKVKPLLTPDNYRERIMEWIGTAKRSLYLQFSYITWSDKEEDEEFRDLLNLVADKTYDDSLDVRVIVGASNAQDKVPLLIEAGFNEEVIRAQRNVHNKGIIVDGESVLVSSANWSSDGVLRNRDAGLIIFDREVAQYYQDVFLDDWNKRAKRVLDGAATTARLAMPGERAPPGMVRISWADFYGD
jgi:phosphatidylserine/phosphatidylglycerophosphate/cardiolipin synthase-like enzyme